jgi:hypothetical protein
VYLLYQFTTQIASSLLFYYHSISGAKHKNSQNYKKEVLHESKSQATESLKKLEQIA